MSITGPAEGPAVRVGTSITDILTGMYGAISIVSAVRHRDQTGEGMVIDLAMLDCAVSALENAVSRFAVTGEVPQPLGTRHPSITPFQAFPVSDGAVVVAAGNDSLWRKLCEVLGCPEYGNDSRLATNAARTENHPYLEECLNPRFGQENQTHWLEKLTAAGVPCAPIRNVAQVVEDPHLASREMLHQMLDTDGQPFVTTGSPLRMNSHSPPLSKHAPNLGEHSQSVLTQWLGDKADR